MAEGHHDHHEYVRRDVYDAKHLELERADERLEEADKAANRRIDEIQGARLAEARRNFFVILGAIVSVITAVAAALILSGLLGRAP